jgi:predicted nucleotidyltransferase
MTLEGLNEDFRDLLVLLADAGVEFVIVGAYALAFHGAPRASGDIDLFVRPSAVNAERLFGVLVRFGAPVHSAGVTPTDFAQPGAVYQIGLPPRRIDLLTEISGVTFDEAWASRTTAEVEGRSVSFIGRETLIKNKKASGRLKDVADVARLRKTPPAREV